MVQTDLFDAPTGPMPSVAADDEGGAPVPAVWYDIQARAHELADLVATVEAPRLGKVDRFLADRLEVMANYVDRILRPLEVPDEPPSTERHH